MSPRPPHFPWRSDLDTGLPEVDAQHRELFARARDLLGAYEDGGGPQEIARLFDQLDRYADSHFAAEERLMEEHAYPGRRKHRVEHHYFARGAATLRRRLAERGAGPELAGLLRDFLSDWLAGHIADSDRDLVRHVIARLGAPPRT